MANNNLTINVTVSGVEDFEKLTREFEKLKALVGADRISVEPSEPTYRLVSGRDARVGDFVKFTEESYEWITVGKYYEVVGFDEFGDAQVIDNDGDAFDLGGETYEIYEKVTESLDVPEPETLKVGDYAKVVSASYAHSFDIGEIVKRVEGNGPESGYPRFVSVINSYTQYLNPKDIEKISEDEAKNEVERQQAETKETARWAEIGRKPNEYKEGDIVRVVESTGRLPVGTIGEIGCSDGDIYQVNTVDIDYGNWHLPERIELITPVEARFDRE